MQEFIASKTAQIIDLKGPVYTSNNQTLLNVGDEVSIGMALILSEGSSLTLAFDDGTQQEVSENLLSELAVELEINDTANKNEDITAEEIDNTINTVADDIAEIQELIESGENVELPETAAGDVLNNPGTSFATLNRDGEELIAQAGYDTTGPEGTGAALLSSEADILIENLPFNYNSK